MIPAEERRNRTQRGAVEVEGEVKRLGVRAIEKGGEFGWHERRRWPARARLDEDARKEREGKWMSLASG